VIETILGEIKGDKRKRKKILINRLYYTMH